MAKRIKKNAFEEAATEELEETGDEVTNTDETPKDLGFDFADSSEVKAEKTTQEKAPSTDVPAKYRKFKS